jgi:hypothetical protein
MVSMSLVRKKLILVGMRHFVGFSETEDLVFRNKTRD